MRQLAEVGDFRGGLEASRIARASLWQCESVDRYTIQGTHEVSFKFRITNGTVAVVTGITGNLNPVVTQVVFVLFCS